MKSIKIDGVKPSYLPKSYILGAVATSIVFFLASICTGVSAEKAESTTALTFPIDCRPYHLRSMKFLLKSFNKCSRELKANTSSDKEYEENMGCAMKCTMRVTGYAVNDLVTIDSIRESVAKLVPTALVEPITQTLVTKCHQKYGDKLNPNEAQCRAYSEYAFCIQNCIADLVDSEFCIKYDRKGNIISS